MGDRQAVMLKTELDYHRAVQEYISYANTNSDFLTDAQVERQMDLLIAIVEYDARYYTNMN